MVTASQGATRVFDVPAGDAISTLKRAAQQAGMEIVFPAKLVRGVKTNAVKGDFTPEAAFDLLTANTALTVVWDKQSGALIVQRQPASPAAPVGPKAAKIDEERVLHLDTFTVTTSVGTYREATTTAGSKTPMSTKDVAGTVQVLNASFIEDKQARSLEDLYPYVVGMTRESPAASGFTLRGFSNNFTNTMINNIQFDGLPGGASRFGSPPTANVDRVEVLKGPSSVINGVMDPGGIINIISKQPSVKPGSSLVISAASFAGQHSPLGQDVSLTATLDSTGPLDEGRHWLYRFIASYEDLNGFRQFDFGKNYYFYPSLTYRFDPDTEVTFKIEIDRQRRYSSQDSYLAAPFLLIANVPADHSLSYTDRNNEEYDKAETYNLVFRHRFDNQWTLKLNVRDVQHGDGRTLDESHTLRSVLPVEDSSIVQRYRYSINTRRYAYYDLNVYGTVGPETFQHTLLFGLSAGYETHEFHRLFSVDLPGAINVYHPVQNVRPQPYELGVVDLTNNQPQDAVSHYYNYGAYVSDQMKIGQHWRASAGLRHESYDTRYYDSAFIKRTTTVVNPGQTNKPKATVPSVGLVYQPDDTTSFYASYGQGFKPTPPQSAPLPTPTHPAAATLPSEKAGQVEVGAKLDFLANTLDVLLSVYDIKRDGVTQAIPLSFDPVTNAPLFRQTAQESKGVELSVNYQPRPYCQMQLGYSFDDAKITGSSDPATLGARVPNAPRHSANFWGRYNVPQGALRGFGVGLGLIFTGDRPGLLSNIPAQSMQIPSNFRLDLAFYYKWKRGDLGLNITNLLDKSYIASADTELDVVPGAPRKITVSARYAF
ncbi:TonB-dependent receptor [Opitutus sp. GAS368]|uniref:TonB-dependent siderophore receptor n=1 Tax=Opitutus sp. GAS368 TaxID=1882749 RepID=UPI00087A23A4|nr:TonB-dependent receptor [Opitutus sp. GAS368]SDR89225.1 iron complex outermembrane recepter protein [Opitutus sp. GAS368]